MFVLLNAMSIGRTVLWASYPNIRTLSSEIGRTNWGVFAVQDAKIGMSAPPGTMYSE